MREEPRLLEWVCRACSATPGPAWHFLCGGRLVRDLKQESVLCSWCSEQMEEMVCPMCARRIYLARN